ncbi:MAG: hypothetical protein A2Z99_19630 [Treponema sp. GWB1_62_6]|nr:MAG: hypothetical protein A2Y36_12145 [Treponema sp. GWA1_62_8]OHE65875.1 MAG: hypothetical protein A2001_12095 [Treponema sp. GWC1_61_84]OHE68779.1 MAG: hypothetical protein A2413_09260 [Treponema sp. RIFOXYC1_FULL_61_9]OHE72258.1 MAG: hypothetical protein A2Z99_19630 [Treponema sp. GWB1_62_6]
MKRICLMPLLLAMLGVGVLPAQELVQFDQANPPFMYAKGEVAAGLYPALFKEAFSRMGVRTELTAVPWKRALDDTDAGRAGTGGIYQNSERLKKYDFSEPFYEERLAIFVPTGKEFGFDKMEDLYGKSFNVLSGWSYGDDFDAAVKAGKITSDSGATNDKSNFLKMMDGRNNGVISIVESGEAAIKALKLEGKVKMLPKFLVINKVYLAFGKTARKEQILAAFNKAMYDMKRDGTFNKIVEESFSGN